MVVYLILSRKNKIIKTNFIFLRKIRATFELKTHVSKVAVVEAE